MKRFMVEQNGYVQLEAWRTFIVEVPNHFTEEQVYELVNGQDDLIEEKQDGGWVDDLERAWIGYDVDIVETSVDPVDDDETDVPALADLEVVRIEQKGTHC